MSRGRNNQLTGQIAEHLVVAELGRRGLAATGFSGNIPTFDVLAVDENCRVVPIQVKASRGGNWPSDAQTWMDIDINKETFRQEFGGPRTLATPRLIHVCVAIAPLGNNKRDRFFVLTMKELQDVCIAAYSRWMNPTDWKRPRSPHSLDCRYKITDLTQFEDKWDIIHDRLKEAGPALAALPDHDIKAVAS